MATVTLELKSYADKQGLQQLRIMLREGRQRSIIMTEIKIKKTQWDQQRQKITGHPMAQQLNQALEVKLSKLRGDIALKQLQTGAVDLDAVSGAKVRKTAAAEYGRLCIRSWEGRKKPGTLRMLTCHMGLLEQYHPGLKLQDITPAWLKAYEEALRRKGLQNPGIRKRMDYVGLLTKQALRDDILEKDPFLKFTKPPTSEGKTVWLTLDEVAAIRALAGSTPAAEIKAAAWWFCLACYTGLRFGDVQKFGPQFVQQGRVILETNKTGETISLKIFPALQQCIDAVATLPPVDGEVNKLLKIIAAQCGISKRLHFHVARHTFATNSLILGSSMDVVQKMLGHSKIEQTQRYAKIINQVVDKAMQCWEAVA